MLLYRYISKQILIWIVISTAALIGIVWLSQTLRLIELLVNKGADFTDFVLLSILTIPLWLIVILPTAALIATMLVLNKLQQDREITALSSIGMSNLVIMRGPLAVGLAMTIFLYVNSALILPLTFSGYKSMMSNLRTAAPIVVLQQGVFTDITDGLTVFIKEKKGRYQFNNIFVSDRRNPEKTVEVVADSGYLDLVNPTPQLVFFRGTRSELTDGDTKAAMLNFKRYALDLTSDFKPGVARALDYNEMGIQTLLMGRNKNPKYIREMWAEGHFRLASPLLGLAMVIIGAAAILSRQYVRASSWRMLALGGFTAIVIQIALIITRSLTIEYPGLYLGQYAVAVFPILAGLWTLRQPSRIYRVAGS